MKFPRRRFLHLAVGATACADLSTAVQRIAFLALTLAITMVAAMPSLGRTPTTIRRGLFD